MKKATIQQKQIMDLLKKHTVMTLGEISKEAKCSRNTIFLKLRDHEYVTSYNANKQYFTLREICQFDENGLWNCREARFSKWGGVKKTVIALVEKSHEGMTTGMINSLMHVRTNKQLGELVKEGRIIRKLEGRNQYYFGAKPEIQSQQMKRWHQARERKEAQKIALPNETIIQVLVTMINERETDPKRLKELLHLQGIKIDLRELQLIFTRYGIKKRPIPKTT
jgi:hypothetical protein